MKFLRRRTRDVLKFANVSDLRYFCEPLESRTLLDGGGYSAWGFEGGQVSVYIDPQGQASSIGWGDGGGDQVPMYGGEVSHVYADSGDYEGSVTIGSDTYDYSA